MYQGRYGDDCDECEVYLPERSEGGIHTSHITTMSLEVHTAFCVQIGGKSRVACERVVSGGQSSFGRYEHFARFWRRGTIDCMPLYAQACNVTFSARLDTKYVAYQYWNNVGNRCCTNAVLPTVRSWYLALDRRWFDLLISAWVFEWNKIYKLTRKYPSSQF